MVKIHPPPPHFPVDPKFETVPASSSLVRIFDPTDHNQTATSFRFHGPLKRFDHQRSFGAKPADDPQRGIYYAAFSLAGSLAEIFLDNSARRVTPAEKHVAYVSIVRDLRVLDLRGVGGDNGAVRAGCVAALTTNADHRPSQEWSRYFYEHPEIYSEIDGLIYNNAHNHDNAVALYERGRDGLLCAPTDLIRLDDPYLRPVLQAACLQIHLVPPTF